MIHCPILTLMKGGLGFIHICAIVAMHFMGSDSIVMNWNRMLQTASTRNMKKN